MTGGEGDEAPLFDPMADVLFGAASLLILALILIMPAVGRPRDPADTARRPAQAQAQAIDDRIYTDAAGLAYGATMARIPLDRILDDPGFATWLAGRHATGASVELVVAADGGEAAFVAEPVIARARIGEVAVARLDRSCGPAPTAAALTRCIGALASGAPPSEGRP